MVEDQEGEAERVERRRFPIFLVAIVALIALLVLWSARKPIARNYIDDQLTKRGVQGRYTITHFGFRSQRLEKALLHNS